MLQASILEMTAEHQVELEFVCRASEPSQKSGAKDILQQDQVQRQINLG